jgi:hypothetical protein
MLTNPRRGIRALALMVLTIAVSLSQRAQAQQTGLFPLAPIRRQRVPCDQEDPVYKTYKQQYFGYHPTYWRRFPEGWSVPSPEGPDRERSFREFKLGSEREGGEKAPGEEEMPGPPGGGRATPVPNIPQPERSPFETDTPNGRPGAAPATPRGGQAPRATPPPEGARSPFEETPNPGAMAPAARRNQQVRTDLPPASDLGPDLSAPNGQPEQGSGLRSMQDGRDEEAVAPREDAPMLAVPDIDLPGPGQAGSLVDDRAATPAANSPSTFSATAPRPRRGLLSNLFSNLGLNWTRR